MLIERKTKSLSAVTLLIGLTLAPVISSAGWYDGNWQYRREITIQSSEVVTALTNFPVLIQLSSDAALAAGARSDGFDILFTDDDGTTKLAHQIEEYVTGNGELVAWVKVPSLPATVDKTLYLYYGYASSSNQGNPSGVWTEGFDGVWHWDDDLLDSASSNHGTNQGSTDSPAKFADGQSFDGVDDYVDLTVMNPKDYDDFTISAWYKSADMSASDDEYIYMHFGTDATEELVFGPTDDGGDALRLGITWGGSWEPYYSTTDIVDQQWHHLVGVRGGGRIKVWVDGNKEVDAADPHSGSTHTLDISGPFSGDDPGETEQVHGTVDELRLANAARSDGWVETEFNNQDNPAGFLNLGPQETSSSSISSAANQTFYGNYPSVSMVPLAISAGSGTPAITALNDIRIRIPAGFNMTWDNTVLTATIAGSAASKVSTTVTYEDGDGKLVLDVTTDFVTGDQITVSGLSFADFGGSSPVGNLELEVANDDLVTALDDKTITVISPVIQSFAKQFFFVGQDPGPIEPITITDDVNTPSITAGNDIRIVIPPVLPMSWDVLDVNVTLTGTAAAKVDPIVSYENGGAILVLDVLNSFGAGETLVVSDLSFANFTAAVAKEKLELDVFNDGISNDIDGRDITIDPAHTITSAANQAFLVGDPPTAISPITITASSAKGKIEDANDIRIRIPAGFSMAWDTTDLVATISGPAALNVATAVTYEDGGKTLVLDVLSDFAEGDAITISDLRYLNFTANSSADRLELEVKNDGIGSSFDDKTIIIGPGTSSTISGVVFEDADFAGTASDFDGGVSDAGQPNVDVELYDNTDIYITSTITDAGGNFNFNGLSDGTYKVRTRSATIGDADTTPAGGLHPTVPGTWPYPLPDMTWGHGSALIGGQDSTVDDTTVGDNAGPSDTWVTVTVSGGDVTGVNLGFCYDVITNDADDTNADSLRSRQGTLRQFIKNSNAVVGVNKSWFLIPSI